MMVCLTLATLLTYRGDSHHEDRDLLVRGVTTLIAPNSTPGPLNCSGDAFTVITAKQGKASVPLVVATKVESGRAIALGHEGFFSSKAMQNPSNGRLLANALTWVSRKPLQGLRVGLLGYPNLSKSLTDAGAIPSIIRSQNIAGVLSLCDVVCMTQDALDNDPSGQIEVIRFVKQGHGLLVAGPGWGWLVTHGGKDLLADQSGNRMLVPYGITFEDGNVEEPYSPKGAESPLLNSTLALTELSGGGLSIDDAATATAAVQRSLAHQSVNSREALSIEKLAEKEPGGGIPTPKDPITAAKPFSKLRAWIESKRYSQQVPREVRPDPSAATFPGPVDSGSARLERSFDIDTSVPEWHSTGLYAAPGEVVLVTIPEGAGQSELGVRIGTHTDRLWDLEKWPRFPAISTHKPLRGEYTQIASPFGGLIYIEVPYHCKLGKLHVTIGNAVMAPLFVTGTTSEESWKSMLAQSGAPWAELQGRLVTLTVPIASARKVHNATALMTYWDEVMENCYEFYAAPIRPRPERYCPDVEISAGYMHSGYPIMTHIDVADTMCNLFKLRGKSWTWGFYHEMGHNFQQDAWTWDGCGEVTNNLFSLYGSEMMNAVTPKLYGDAHPAMAPETAKKRLTKYLDAGAHYDSWMSDPFLALTFFSKLRESFGWKPFTQLFEEFRKSPPSEFPKTDLEKRDQFLVRFSKIIGKNLGTYFQKWGIPTTADARSTVADLPSWMPPDWP